MWNIVNTFRPGVRRFTPRYQSKNGREEERLKRRVFNRKCSYQEINELSQIWENLFFDIAAVIWLMQQHNTCRRSLHDRHSHKHLGGGVGRESLSFFRSIYGAHSSILSINTRKPCGRTHTKAAGEKIRENLGFLPSHICVISTRSPSCKVRPWGTDDPSNWLIAVEKQEIEKNTKSGHFSFIKTSSRVYFLLLFVLWGTRLPLLSLSLPTGSSLSLPLFFMNGRARYTSTRDVTNGWGQSLDIQQPAIDGPPSSNAPNYN